MTAPRSGSDTASPASDSPAPTAVPMELRPPANTPILTRWGSRGTAVVLGVAALVMLVLGATVGLALGGGGSTASSISSDGQDPVNTGFARDMVVHHNQGVLMAHIAEMNSTDK